MSAGLFGTGSGQQSLRVPLHGERIALWHYHQAKASGDRADEEGSTDIVRLGGPGSGGTQSSGDVEQDHSHHHSHEAHCLHKMVPAAGLS